MWDLEKELKEQWLKHFRHKILSGSHISAEDTIDFVLEYLRKWEQLK